jgi:hypothetical protein
MLVPFAQQSPTEVLLSYIASHRAFDPRECNLVECSVKPEGSENHYSMSYIIRAIAGIAQITTKELVNTIGPDYEMPLQVAAESGKEKWVNFLLAAGADPRLIVLPIKYHERMGMRGVSQEARQIINAAIATKLAELEEASRLTRAVSAVSTTSTGDNNTVTSTALSRSSSHSRGSNDGESSPSAKVDCSGIQNPLLASLRGAGQAYSAESTAERWE